MVVPVPCRLLTALKFETRMSPGLTLPFGNWGGTNATPYGFTSPFAGTVETLCTGEGRNGWWSSSCALTAAGNTKRRTERMSRLLR